MAVYTVLTLEEATRVSVALGVGRAVEVRAIAAGSVNSNFWLVTDTCPYFFRIYEEQDATGVAYEWAVLDALGRAGVPVPKRVGSASAGALQVADKPIGLFEAMPGEECCQATVTPKRAHAVGQCLARTHLALRDFPTRRAGRFTLEDIALRLGQAHGGPVDDLERLRETLAIVRARWPAECPGGVIHGDLFRDNVRWEGDRIVGVLDWESASDGLWVYDLAVTWLAWCFGDALDRALSMALWRGYRSVRELEPSERAAIRTVAQAACVRFATTRITDFLLRPAIGDRVHKDYRRFVARLDAVEAQTEEALLTLALG